MIRGIFRNLVCIVLILICSCTHNSVVNTNENDPSKSFYPPYEKGSFTFNHTIEEEFPDYMNEVKELDIRVPLVDHNISLPVIIVEPGFFSVATDLNDIMNRYASHGFLVIGVTNKSHFNLITTSLDPYKIAITQTIKYLVEESKVSSSKFYGLIDTNAIGITGHSMGGGGIIKVCNDLNLHYAKYVKTAIAMNPFGKCDGSNISIPMFLFSSDKDDVINPFMLGVSSKPEDVYHSFNSIQSNVNKLFANFREMDHNAVVDKNILLSSSGNADRFLILMVSWFKVYLSNDKRYCKYFDNSSDEYENDHTFFINHGKVPAYLYNKN